HGAGELVLEHFAGDEILEIEAAAGVADGGRVRHGILPIEQVLNVKAPFTILSDPAKRGSRMLIDTTSDGGSRIVGAIRTAAQATGVGFDYLLKTAIRESSLDPNAKASTSSAVGLF